jgi:peptidoglycan/LPS O-acetylase OafA/YrhL
MASEIVSREPIADGGTVMRESFIAPAPMTAGVLADHLADPQRNNFNLIRLVAAVAVIYGHSFALSANVGTHREIVARYLPFTYSGALAVAVFFLVSGIFVTASLHRDGSLAGYVVKRFFRLWPGLTVCAGLSVIVAVFFSDHGALTALRLPETWTYVLRNQVLDMQWTIPGVFEDRKYPSINGSLWSLVVEAQMYALVLLLGLFSILKSRSALLAAVLVMATLAAGFPDALTGFVDVRAREVLVPVMFFLVGVALFGLRDIVRVRRRHLAGLAALAFVTDAVAFQIVTYALVAALTVWIGCSPAVARLPRPRGDYSYGIYIYGFPVQQGIVTLWPAATPYAIFLLAVAIALPLAVASWRLVELPGQEAGRSIARRIAMRPGGVPAPAAFLRANGQRVILPAAVTILALVGLASATIRPAELPTAALPVDIVAVGPTPVTHGEPFNVQPGGYSAIWAHLDRPATPDMRLVLGKTRLTTVVDKNLLTAAVPGRLFERAGALPLTVEALRNGRRLRSAAVSFAVQ